MNHGSLFTGVGMFDLAAEWIGWNNIFHCERDSNLREFLKIKFSTISHGAIEETDFTIYRDKIGILTGGDPCQPSSRAGTRKGKEDGRYLWPQYRRAIEEIHPKWIVNENVTGTIENGILDEKISDLETLGYSWWPPVVIPASALGAWHKRERVWLIAHSKRNIQQWEESCSWEVRRMGRQFESVSWDTGWEAALTKFRRMDDGIPRRVDRTDSIRNGIVPQIAYELFKAIQQQEKLYKIIYDEGYTDKDK